MIVAGFQGVSSEGEITTLGRGGSDTTAVALAVALGAGLVEFYKDVPGICEEDPKSNPYAKVYDRLSYRMHWKLSNRAPKFCIAAVFSLLKKIYSPSMSVLF